MAMHILQSVAMAALLAMGTEVAMAGETQIVLQWIDNKQGSIDLQKIHQMEDDLEKASGGKYFVDGHDIGSGTLNIFLYAEDAMVDSTIVFVVHLFEQGKLPKGMRLGRAIYDDEKRTNWHFQPVYPPNLRAFDIAYPPGAVSPK
jgi:hypothetical protein